MKTSFKIGVIIAITCAFYVKVSAQKSDIIASWPGVKTLKEVGGNHAPYKALGDIYIKKDLKQVRINKYETNHQFHDGMLAVANGETGKWGFIDENGNLLAGGYKWYIPVANLFLQVFHLFMPTPK